MGAAKLFVATLSLMLAATGLHAQTSQILTGAIPARAIGHTHDCSGYYPASAQRLNLSGSVIIGYDVQSDGRLTHIAVRRSSGVAELDRAALKCVSERWRDSPATRDGVAVASPNHQAMIQFELQDSAPPSGLRGAFALPPSGPPPAPAATLPANDTGTFDALEFALWTLGPLAILAWILRGARLWVFRRRDCPSCGARNRSIVPFTDPRYCSSCGIKFADAD